LFVDDSSSQKRALGHATDERVGHARQVHRRS
jgi:hypothetical protein